MVDAADSGGGYLRRLRERIQFSQQDLSEASGVSVDAIRKIEQGQRRRPWPRTIRALAISLGIAPAELRQRLSGGVKQ